MTLGEFRDATKGMRDDLEIVVRDEIEVTEPAEYQFINLRHENHLHTELGDDQGERLVIAV